MVKVLDIELFSYDIPTLIDDICALINTKETRLISASSVHGIVTAQKDKNFKDILSRFYYNLPDGMPLAWVGRMKGAKKIKRCYGPDLFAALLKHSADKGINHYFCGGKEGVADELKIACGKKFSNYNVVGTYSPPFREMIDDELKILGEQINKSGANIVWIGISTPKQEKFAYRLKQFTKTDFMITVGAAFDFHTDNLKQAPRWIMRSGFEWLFRLVMEPKRLYKRYLEIVPMFIFYNVKEVLTGNFKK